MGGAMRWLSMVGKWRVTSKSKKKNMIILHNNTTCITTGSNDDDRASTSCADVVGVVDLIPDCNAAINDAAAGPVDDAAAAAGHEVEVPPDSSHQAESESERAHASAVAIQSFFRGHLARRAFRALRSLVKLQAVVRGVCVRNQAWVALRCMHALLRLQARLQASKSTQKTLTHPLI